MLCEESFAAKASGAVDILSSGRRRAAVYPALLQISKTVLLEAGFKKKR
jgi:hypothetical protein